MQGFAVASFISFMPLVHDGSQMGHAGDQASAMPASMDDAIIVCNAAQRGPGQTAPACFDTHAQTMPRTSRELEGLKRTIVLRAPYNRSRWRCECLFSDRWLLPSSWSRQ